MILIKHQKSCSSLQPSARLDDGQIRVNVWVRSHRGALCRGCCLRKTPSADDRMLHHILCCQTCLKLERKGKDYNSKRLWIKVIDAHSLLMPLKHPFFNILPVAGFTQAPVFIPPVPRSSNLVMNLINPRSPASTLL